MSAPEALGAAKARPRALVPKTIVAVCLGLMVLIAAVFAGLRYGVLLPQARVLIEANANGLKIGRLGRLKIEGLGGDIWRDFTIRRLTIQDEKGVWLDARDLRLRWRYAELLRRRFYADAVDARIVSVLRRPTLTPKGKDRGMPVSFEIKQARARLSMEPAFSYRRGVYDLSFNLDVERRGGQRGRVRADSVLHAGDFLDAQFDIGKGRPLKLKVDAMEASGGALAGALGLKADQPFAVKIAADGRGSTGAFTAVATSGSLRPLDATGAWSAEGGQARGRLLLGASTLTEPFARRIGEEAAFAVAGRKASGDLYALDARVTADNLSLVAQGLGDVAGRRIGPQGLRLTLDTPSLSRLAGGPSMGRGHAAGVLRQGRASLDFEGTAAVAELALGGYRLRQVAGPLSLTRDAKGVAVRTRMNGSGGQGAGWAQALLGAAPRAELDGARLADGRLQLNDLDLQGQGLKVSAEGGRSLLGGLNLKGEAVFSNLAAARPGAKGSVSARFAAAQAGAQKPWTLTVDAKGEGVALGYAELDRLLGAKPAFAAQGAFDKGQVSIAKASLNGAAIQASGGGSLGRDGVAAFKVDWSAQGPFRAGPVEITGQARGTGALTGKLAEPRLDLIAEVAAVDLPRLPLTNAHVVLSFLRQANGSSGQVAVTAGSGYGPARARADFAFPQGGVDLTGVDLDAGGLKAAGRLSLRRNTPSAADLTLAVSKGAFLDDGAVTGAVRILDAPGGARANLDLVARDARLPGQSVILRALRVSADGPLARLPYRADGDGFSHIGRWSLNGGGELREAGAGRVLTFQGGGQLGARKLNTAEPAVIRFGGSDQGARLRLVSGDGGRLDLDGDLKGDTANVRLEARALGLGLIDEDLDGRFDASLTAQGQGGRLDGAFTAKLAGARGLGAAAATGIDGTLNGRLADSTLSIDGQVMNGRGLKAEVNLALPTEASAKPFRIAIARQRPMSGRFSANGEVQPLWDLLVGGERTLSGQVQAQGQLSGTLADPQATGSLTVAGGRFEDGPTGLSLRDLDLAADLQKGAVDITRVNAVDGHGGSVRGQGRMSLVRNGVSTFRVDLADFRVIDNEQAVASATGQASIARGADGKVKISGDLAIDRADVSPVLPAPTGVVLMDVVEKNRPARLVASEAAQPTRGSSAGWALDVRLRAPGKVFLRGRGLDVELSLDAKVAGSTSAPQLSGVARIIRGDYEFAGKRFEFDEASVVYLSTRPQNIRLELSATREDPSLTAVVRIRGTAAKPDITLTSSPSLPNDEVLSQVLFGRSASQLSALEAAQLASALSAMAGGGGLDVIGNLRAFARLDRLSIGGGDQQAGMTVSGGKYLTDDVYLELTGGGREGPSATVEWRIRRTLSILSRIGDQSGGKLAIRWKRDY